MATLDDVRRIAMSLPRTTEHLIRDHTKFRVGRLVYASVSPDEERMGFGFPREEREALVASRPEVFMMPLPGDMRYQWVRARLPALDSGRTARAAHRRLVHGDAQDDRRRLPGQPGHHPG